ncbi:hypothetical protein JQ633_29910 [Bradyrhizobium tropiciagri]|uniref:hypothetical protein n=1 Tax=Bradyrhizobium tropiciagri TaxID=312253 RepID=UPI001BABAF05|nr:hypothetical protein [Bradyrhizobium tropiciagri]MBR0874607.1 hypothetical protein [Bradyrhizobium tropiciagri]
MYRILAAAGMFIFTSMIATSAFAEKIYYIHDGPGGSVVEHYAKFQQVAAEYDRVVIDGRCKSSCTMVLGLVPLARICITPRGYFMFHAAHMLNGDRTFNARGTQNMLNAYAPEVRDWVLRHHALEHVDPYTYLYARDVRFIRHCSAKGTT